MEHNNVPEQIVYRDGTDQTKLMMMDQYSLILSPIRSVLQYQRNSAVTHSALGARREKKKTIYAKREWAENKRVSRVKNLLMKEKQWPQRQSRHQKMNNTKKKKKKNTSIDSPSGETPPTKLLSPWADVWPPWLKVNHSAFRHLHSSQHLGSRKNRSGFHTRICKRPCLWYVVIR